MHVYGHVHERRSLQVGAYSMNTVGLIQAHMSSARLPGKILMDLGGKTVLQVLIDRLKNSVLTDIAVITSGSPVDDELVEYCEEHNIKYYRGSNHDVLDRYYRAAKYFKADHVVRLLSDCPLLDATILRKVVSTHLEKGNGFTANYLMKGTFPDGMDVSVFTMQCLEAAWLESESPLNREHVTFYIPEGFKKQLIENDKDELYVRLTIDYKEDLENLRKIVAKLGNRYGSMQEIVDIWNELGLKSEHKAGANWNERKFPPLKYPKGDRYWEEVIKSIPDGVQTFSKHPRQFGNAPKLLVRGKGCRVWDMDDNEFIDGILGLGTVILGHGNEEVNDAAHEATQMFNSPSLAHPYELKLAEKMCDVSGLDMVKFGKNGSDVNSAAVRLARYVTGKSKILACGYHGWHDWYIGSTSWNKGVPQSVSDLTERFAYKSNIQFKTRDAALVILEPVNFEPPEGYLQYLREVCDEHGVLLCFDNIACGFRSPKLDVTPDLATYGKALGNGYPISVLCGKTKYMEKMPEIFYSTTHGGELPSIAAALKTLEILKRDKVQIHIESMGNMFIDGYNELCRKLGINFTSASGFGWWPRYDFTDRTLLTLFQQELTRYGFLTRNTPFICFDYKEPDIREILKAVEKSLITVREAVLKDNVNDLLKGDVIHPVIRDDLIKH